MPLAVTERMIAITTEWGTSIGMKAFSFKDIVFAKLGRLSQGSLCIVLLEIVIEEDFDEVEIFFTFAQRVQVNNKGPELKPPKDLIRKIADLVNEIYGGFPITIQPLCSNCSYRIKTKIVVDQPTPMEKSECGKCEELCNHPDLSTWPW